MPYSMAECACVWEVATRATHSIHNDLPTTLIVITASDLLYIQKANCKSAKEITEQICELIEWNIGRGYTVKAPYNEQLYLYQFNFVTFHQFVNRSNGMLRKVIQSKLPAKLSNYSAEAFHHTK